MHTNKPLELTLATSDNLRLCRRHRRMHYTVSPRSLRTAAMAGPSRAAIPACSCCRSELVEA